MNRMLNNLRNRNIRQIRSIGFGILLLAGLSLLTQCETEPLSPPATQLGEHPSFDKILQNAEARWDFVFTTETQIMTTDIYGNNDHRILDIIQATQQSQARFLGTASISPDGRFFLIPFYYERTLARNQPDAKLILVALTTGTSQIVTPQYNDFQLSWSPSSYWVSPTVFLVRINKFTKQQTNYYRETVKLLRYDVNRLDAPEVLDLITDDPVMRWISESHTLLLASEHEPVGKWESVQAVDFAGTREATPQEIKYFNLNYSVVTGRTVNSPVELRLKKIITATEPLWRTKYWEKNWNRYHILLTDKIVRCSDGEIERTPVWDPELELFTWYEIAAWEDYPVYYMDINGHYRFWHKGYYWGNIPKQ